MDLTRNRNDQLRETTTMNKPTTKSVIALSLLACFVFVANSPNAAIIVPGTNINAASSYTVVGTLIAIDSPIGATANDTASTGWKQVSGSNGDSLANGAISRKAWEPDGTIYSNSNMRWTGGVVTYTFDLADDIIINSVFANWAKQNNSGTTNVYSYNEGVATQVSIDQQAAASAGDLVLNWQGTLSDNTTPTTYSSNFEQLFSGPITVAGGNGFTLTLTPQSGKFPFDDAVVLDYTVPSASELTWDGGDGNWTADHWTKGGSSAQSWEPDANVTFNTSVTNPETITLVGGISANDVTFSGAGPYVIQDNPADDGVTGVDSLTIGGATTIASGVKVTITADTVNTAGVAVNGTLVVDGGLNSSGIITVGATGAIGGDGAISAASFVFNAAAKFWVDPNATLDFGTTSVDFSGLSLGNLANADSLAPGTYVLAIGDDLGLDGLNVGDTWGNGKINGRIAYFQKGSLELVIVPEPSTMILAGLGLMGVTFRRRRR